MLHWAKELKFGDDSLNTLNHNLRVLGRKGIYLINAIATINELEDVKSNLSSVLGSVEFEEGFRYTDYVKNVANVAAHTVGGLVAGKILAKAGFFAIVLKFWKLILLGIAGVGGAIWNFIKRSTKGD